MAIDIEATTYDFFNFSLEAPWWPKAGNSSCPAGVSGRVLTADDMTAHNTFDKPEPIKPVAFNNFSLSDDMLKVELPAKSVVVLEIW